MLNALNDRALARNQDKQCPWQKSDGSTDLLEASPRPRRVSLGQQISSEVSSRTGRRSDAYSDEERKHHLPQIVALPGVTAKQIAQRPLQEQEGNQWQCKPLGGSHNIADQAIEAAQEHCHFAIPLNQFQPEQIARLEGCHAGGFIARSPEQVSRNGSILGYWAQLTIFGRFRRKRSTIVRDFANSQKHAVGRLCRAWTTKILQIECPSREKGDPCVRNGPAKGWLGREDSNLRMVESKSARILNDFNGFSDETADSAP